MITCSQCKAENPPELDTCEHCQADLLPQPSPSSRAWEITRAALFGLLIVAIGLGPLIFWWNISSMTAWDSFAVLVILAGLIVLARGLVRAIRPAPLYTRYLDRAARHVLLDPDQAIMDFIHGTMLAPVRARPSISKRLPKKLRTLVAQSEYARIASPGGYQSAEGIRRIVYSAYTTWARLSETIPEFGQATRVGWDAGVAKSTSDRKRHQILSSLGKLLNELAADGLVQPLGYCPRCKSVVTCDESDHCSCDPKHGTARGVVYVVPSEVNLFTRRLRQAYAGS